MRLTCYVNRTAPYVSDTLVLSITWHHWDSLGILLVR